MKKDKKNCCDKKALNNKIKAQEKGKNYFEEVNKNEVNIDKENKDN